MGCRYDVKCVQCEYKFNINEGGGFFFHLLRCDLYGEELRVEFNEIGEAHLKYLKELPGPYCVASIKLTEVCGKIILANHCQKKNIT